MSLNPGIEMAVTMAKLQTQKSRVSSVYEGEPRRISLQQNPIFRWWLYAKWITIIFIY